MINGGEIAGGGIASFILPWIISLLKKESWSRSTKFLLAAVLCLGTAAIVTAINGDLSSGKELGVVFLGILGLTTVFFQAVWQGTGIDDTLTKFNLTSLLTGKK